MSELSRRAIMLAAATTCIAGPCLCATDDDSDLIGHFTGAKAMPSARVHVQIPPVFGNGYSVPLTLVVESPMTEADHVRSVHVLAPKNPIILVARFNFTPACGRAMISTRIRLARSQNVVAVAQMSDGTWLQGRTWVKVDVDGCA